MAESSQAASSAPASSTSSSSAASASSSTTGAASADFMSMIGPDLGKNEAFSAFKDTGVKGLAEAYLSEKGKPPVYAPPPKDATDEQRAAYYKAAGVPDDAKGYNFAKPANWPKDMPYDEAHATQWAESLKKMNVPASLANELRNALLAEQMAEYTANAEQKTAMNGLLDKALGAEKAVVIEKGRVAMEKAITDPKLLEMVKGNLTPEGQAIIGMMSEYFAKNHGQSDTNGDDKGNTSSKSLAELREEAAKLMASEPYKNLMHKDHAKVRDEAKAMYAQIAALTEAAQKK